MGNWVKETDNVTHRRESKSRRRTGRKWRRQRRGGSRLSRKIIEEGVNRDA